MPIILQMPAAQVEVVLKSNPAMKVSLVRFSLVSYLLAQAGIPHNEAKQTCLKTQVEYAGQAAVKSTLPYATVSLLGLDT